jgi:hypothetical protein
MRRPFRRWIAQPQMRRVMLGGLIRMAIHAANSIDNGGVAARLKCARLAPDWEANA